MKVLQSPPLCRKEEVSLTSFSASRTASLDVLKCLCAFFVVCIHTHSYNLSGDLLRLIARVAVPAFFMITGFYFEQTYCRHRVGAAMRKLLRLLCGATCFYCLFSAAGRLFDCYQSNIWNGWQSIFPFFNLRNLYLFLVYGENACAYHLWYLHAAFFALGMMWLVCRSGRLYMGYVLATIFWGCGYALSFTGQYMWYRNFLFMGFPYMMLGHYIAAQTDQIRYLFAGWCGWIFVVLGCVALIGEFLIYRYLDLVPMRSHYLFLPAVVVALFGLAVSRPSMGSGTWAAVVGRKYSAQIYIWHLLFIWCIPRLLGRFFWPEWTWFRAMIVFLLTIAVVALWQWGRRCVQSAMVREQ